MSESNKIFVNNSFDLDIVKIIFKRNWYWLLLIFAVALTSAFFYLRYTKPLYESKSLIQISSENQGANVLDFKSLEDESSISKEIELLRSQLLFKRALQDLNLKVSHYAEGDVLTEKRYGRNSFEIVPFALKDSSLCNHNIYVSAVDNQVKISLNNYKRKGEWLIEPNKLLCTPFFDIKVIIEDWDNFYVDATTNSLFFQFNDPDGLVSKHIRNLSVKPVDIRAKTIEIGYESHSVLFARDIVRSVMNNFFEYDEDFKKESADNVLDFIKKQLDSLKNELSNSKDSLMYFQRRENLPNASSYAESVESKLESFRIEEFELMDELRTLRMLNEKLRESPNSMEVYRMIPELVGKSFESSLNQQVQDLQLLIEQKEDLKYSVTEENESYLKIESRIDNRIKYINKIIQTLENRINEKLEFVKKEIKKLEGDYYDLPEKQMELSRLKNIQELNEKYYTLLTEKKVLYSISNAGYASRNKVLNPASLGNSPISPNKNIVYGISIFFSLSLGFGILLIKYLTFNEISQLSELQKILPEGIGVLGSVPLTNRKMTHSQLLVSEAPKSRISESFRTIRTNLSFVKKNVRTIAVTSSISGEGKTFVALNLGGIIAMSGKKVVILDLDMRKPKIHLGFEADNTLGMSNLLADHSTVSEVLKKSNVDNLYYISAGPIPPNPSELILSAKFDQIIEELKNQFDTVIIDNPPVGLVSDGVNVLAKADVPIFIFKANYSKRHFISNLEDITKPKEIKNLNIILNAESKSKRSYGYGYGGYYSDDPKK
tara:strand:+ start:22115 stop:24436 length:2322 start_codon:yes stop_codon:yes gene_type:complete